MSQTGSLVFYTSEQTQDARLRIRGLCQLSGATQAITVSRSRRADREWTNFLRDLAGRERSVDDYRVVGRRVPVFSVEDYYRNGKSLRLDLGYCALGARIRQAVEMAIPVDIRDDFAPSDLFVQIGAHDLFECAEHDEGYLIARAFCSIRFFGYSSPRNWVAFRAMVFLLPEVQAVKKELEAVTGPLEQCIYWYVWIESVTLWARLRWRFLRL